MPELGLRSSKKPSIFFTPRIVADRDRILFPNLQYVCTFSEVVRPVAICLAILLVHEQPSVPLGHINSGCTPPELLTVDGRVEKLNG
ncbi:hypothetical protein [Microcoleus vaginatus]|uniref:hypothetical protein n=1 Tax=Microcoleus vaginatus TaxID=119532 RepID=UPI0032A7130E